MKTRRQQYAEFLRALSRLFAYALARDIIIKGNEWWRSFETAEKYAKQKRGIKNSKHCYSLAVDLYIVGKTGKEVLFGNDRLEFEQYKILGDYWEKTLGQIWGESIRKGDVFHFEYCEKPVR